MANFGNHNDGVMDVPLIMNKTVHHCNIIVTSAFVFKWHPAKVKKHGADTTGSVIVSDILGSATAYDSCLAVFSFGPQI